MMMGDISDSKINDVDSEVYWTTAGSEHSMVIDAQLNIQ